MDYVLYAEDGAPRRTSMMRSTSRCVRVLAHISAVVTSLVRMILALVVATLVAPVVAPALLMLLPQCALVRALERLATRLANLVMAVAGVRALIGPKCDAQGARSAPWHWLAAPVVRAWESPLVRGHVVATYDQPGRWMDDRQLERLAHVLLAVANASMETVPQHRLFDEKCARKVLSNRIISVVHGGGGTPLGFSALVYLPYSGDFLVHLGLTMIGEAARGQRLQSPLFTKCLTLVAVNHCRISYCITNIAASPAGIGAVSDYFFDVFPNYNPIPRQPFHLGIARHILRYYRHEFGCSANAHFDEQTFVVHRSNAEVGGGSHAFIKEDGKPISQHKNPRCNAFVKRSLDLRAGDELFQVGRVHVVATAAKYLFQKKPKLIRAPS